MVLCLFFFFKQKTAYEMRISVWSSDVCSSDLQAWPQGELLADDGAELAGSGELGDNAAVFQCGDDFGVLDGFAYGVGQHLQMSGRRVGRREQYEGVAIGRATCREREC